jgi:hypothetical protein
MFWKTVGRWAIVAVAVPLAAGVIRKIGRTLENRSGSSRVSRTLGRTASGLETLTGRKRAAVR